MCYMQHEAQDANTSSVACLQPRPGEGEQREGEEGQAGKQQVLTAMFRACEDMMSGILCVCVTGLPRVSGLSEGKPVCGPKTQQRSRQGGSQ